MSPLRRPFCSHVPLLPLAFAMLGQSPVCTGQLQGLIFTNVFKKIFFFPCSAEHSRTLPEAPDTGHAEGWQCQANEKEPKIRRGSCSFPWDHSGKVRGPVRDPSHWGTWDMALGQAARLGTPAVMPGSVPCTQTGLYIPTSSLARPWLPAREHELIKAQSLPLTSSVCQWRQTWM